MQGERPGPPGATGGGADPVSTRHATNSPRTTRLDRRWRQLEQQDPSDTKARPCRARRDRGGSRASRPEQLRCKRGTSARRCRCPAQKVVTAPTTPPARRRAPRAPQRASTETTERLSRPTRASPHRHSAGDPRAPCADDRSRESRQRVPHVAKRAPETAARAGEVKGRPRTRLGHSQEDRRRRRKRGTPERIRSSPCAVSAGGALVARRWLLSSADGLDTFEGRCADQSRARRPP